jgi:hypothetical protein
VGFSNIKWRWGRDVDLSFPSSRIAYGGCCLFGFLLSLRARCGDGREAEICIELVQERNASHSLEEKVRLVVVPRVCRRGRPGARRERGTVRSGFFVLRQICRFRLRTRRLRVRLL